MGCNPFSNNFIVTAHKQQQHAWQGACVAGRGVHGRGGACPCHACPPVTHPPYDMRSMSGQYTYYWNAFLFSMRTLSIASSQSCGNVDLDAWCKQTRRFLRIMLICSLWERFMFPWRITSSRHKHCLNYCSCRFWLWIMEQFYLLYLSTDFRLSSKFVFTSWLVNHTVFSKI